MTGCRCQDTGGKHLELPRRALIGVQLRQLATHQNVRVRESLDVALRNADEIRGCR
jgi:hypothetical protein